MRLFLFFIKKLKHKQLKSISTKKGQTVKRNIERYV